MQQRNTGLHQEKLWVGCWLHWCTGCHFVCWLMLHSKTHCYYYHDFLVGLWYLLFSSPWVFIHDCVVIKWMFLRNVALPTASDTGMMAFKVSFQFGRAWCKLFMDNVQFHVCETGGLFVVNGLKRFGECI